MDETHDATPPSDLDARLIRIDRELAGELTRSHGHGDRPDVDAAMVNALGAMFQAPAASVDAVARVSARLDERIRHDTPGVRKPKVLPWRAPSRTARTAVLFALAAAATFAVVQLAPERGTSARAVEVREVVASAGRRARVELVDGTRVVLAPGSRLRYPADFGASHRQVDLEGQAYFEVVPDAARPYVVRAGDSETQVLGTAFSVRAYADEPQVRIVVASGKVTFGRRADSSIATPPRAALSIGDAASVDRAGEVTIARHVDVATLLAWTDGQLMFRNAPVAEVLRDVGRWYGVEMRLADPVLESERVTGSIDDRSLAGAITEVALLLGATAERDGARITFRPGR